MVTSAARSVELPEDLAERMRIFEHYAADLGVRAVEGLAQEARLGRVTHLLAVSCTGLYAPGLDLQRASADAGFLGRVKAAGAVFLGKLNLHEWALGVTNDNPHFGACRLAPRQRQHAFDDLAHAARVQTNDIREPMLVLAHARRFREQLARVTA